MTALNLTKGSALSLKKNGATIKKVRLDLSWDPDGKNPPYDLDVSVLGLVGDQPGRCPSADLVCFFNQPKTAFAQHLKGDNRTGAGDGVDESLAIDLSALPSDVDFVPALVTMYNAAPLGQSFANVSSAKAEAYNAETGEHLATINLAKLDAGSMSCIFCAFKRTGNEWELVNVSQGYPKELGDFFALYGLA